MWNKDIIYKQIFDMVESGFTLHQSIYLSQLLELNICKNTGNVCILFIALGRLLLLI